MAEEKHFLKDYTIPFVQLDYKQTSLMFSHIQNTLDKKMLLNSGDNKYVKHIDYRIENIIKNKELREYYTTHIDKLLKEYDIGDIKFKRGVSEQSEIINKIIIDKRNRINEDKNKLPPTFTITNPDGAVQHYSVEQILNVLNDKEQYINQLKKDLKEKDIELRQLKQNMKKT